MSVTYYRLKQQASNHLQNVKMPETGLFCLNYLMQKFSSRHQDKAFLYLYDKWIETQESSCEPEDTIFNWARKKASILREVQIGSIAPDFQLMKGQLNLHQLQSDYTLVLFWASWCGHCTNVLPEIKRTTDSVDSKWLTTVAISLDTDGEAWQQLVQSIGLNTWFNTSELKGWGGEIPRRYNVYATPTMFLLDKEKRIVAMPGNIGQLEEQLAMQQLNNQ